MKKLILIIACMLALGLSANAQDVQCPADRVCITVEQGRKALVDADTVKAQAVELKAKDAALADYRDEVQLLRIEVASQIGQRTGSEQMNIRLTAIVDILLKSTKKKCFPFSICF